MTKSKGASESRHLELGVSNGGVVACDSAQVPHEFFNICAQISFPFPSFPFLFSFLFPFPFSFLF